MAEENFNLIHYVAHSFSNSGIPHDELVSVGSVGYTKALNTYNTNKATKFSTYAVYCIKNEILHFLRKEKKHKENSVLSGNFLFSDEEGNTLSVEDTISGGMNGEILVEDYILLKEDISILMKAINKLPERERIIIINRYGLNGENVLTQRKIGKQLGMSQANVSKIEKNIVEKLSKELDGKIKIEKNEFYFDYCDKKKKPTDIFPKKE